MRAKYYDNSFNAIEILCSPLSSYICEPKLKLNRTKFINSSLLWFFYTKRLSIEGNYITRKTIFSQILLDILDQYEIYGGKKLIFSLSKIGKAKRAQWTKWSVKSSMPYLTKRDWQLWPTFMYIWMAGIYTKFVFPQITYRIILWRLLVRVLAYVSLKFKSSQLRSQIKDCLHNAIRNYGDNVNLRKTLWKESYFTRCWKKYIINFFFMVL